MKSVLAAFLLTILSGSCASLVNLGNYPSKAQEVLRSGAVVIGDEVKIRVEGPETHFFTVTDISDDWIEGKTKLDVIHLRIEDVQSVEKRSYSGMISKGVTAVGVYAALAGVFILILWLDGGGYSPFG